MLNKSEEKEITDYELVQLIINGDINKFAVIVDRYEKKLLKYILTKTNISVGEGESLLQDVFIKVYKNINGYNKDYTFNSWIYKITHNLVIDNYKKEQKNKLVSLDVILDEDSQISLINLLEDKNTNIENIIEKKEISKEILKIINKLDDKYKEVIILRYLEGFSYEEISDILKLSYNSVGTLLRRAKKNLHKLAIENKLDKYL